MPARQKTWEELLPYFEQVGFSEIERLLFVNIKKNLGNFLRFNKTKIFNDKTTFEDYQKYTEVPSENLPQHTKIYQEVCRIVKENYNTESVRSGESSIKNLLLTRLDDITKFIREYLTNPNFATEMNGQMLKVLSINITVKLEDKRSYSIKSILDKKSTRAVTDKSDTATE
ncbi:MAG: hypothetical protein GW761_11235 [Leptospira sp.]|nr:hypothetical protein [Leptospira sp.]